MANKENFVSDVAYLAWKRFEQSGKACDYMFFSSIQHPSPELLRAMEAEDGLER